MAWAWGKPNNVQNVQTQETVEDVVEDVLEETVEDVVEDTVEDVVLFDPHSSEWLSNKFDTYNILRAGETANWSKKYQMYVLTRYDDVMFALNNPEIFSSDEGNLIVKNSARSGIYNTVKDIVNNAYSTDNIERIADAFAESCKELIKSDDNLNISEIIEDLSATATAELINAPFKKAEIKQYIKHMQKFYTDDSGHQMFTNLLRSMVDTLKIPAKGAGLYKEVVTNNLESTHLESVFVESATLVASSVTGALEILTLDLFRENKLGIILADRSLIPNLVNESMRFHTSTGRVARIVKQQVTLQGVVLEPGTRVVLCLESANRDPAMFSDPDKFLLGRNTAGQVAFDHNVTLTKKLMQVWVEQLLDLYGKYKIVTENTDLEYVITASGNDNMISNICLTTDK